MSIGETYAEGVMGDGAVFLRDGQPLTISEVLALLNERDRLKAEIVATREVCALVRRQDYFDVPTPVLVAAQIEAAAWHTLQNVMDFTRRQQPGIDAALNSYRVTSRAEATKE